jgi:hypothetical protein
MKIPFNKSLASKQVSAIVAGRHVGTITQIAGLGDQPAYKVGNPPEASVGIVVQLSSGQLTKKMRAIGDPRSKLFEFLHATLPDPDGFDGDDPLPLTLGRPVAIEVIVNGQYANIVSFHRPETFELNDIAPVNPVNLVMLDSPDVMTGEAGKDLFMKLHRDIRSWISKRVREQK